MNKSVMSFLTAYSLIGGGEFGMEYLDDKDINECLMDMYFYMLYNGMDNDIKCEEYFHEFEKKYDKLNKEQQDIVKKEYFDIIEAQKKNKGKVKKKGMINYE